MQDTFLPFSVAFMFIASPRAYKYDAVNLCGSVYHVQYARGIAAYPGN